jgi:hypothetical protein
MPPHDRVRLHEHQGRPPVAPDSGQGDPKESVARLEGRALGRASHRPELLPQRQVLEHQFLMSAQGPGQRATDHDERLQHEWIVAGVDARINAHQPDEFWRGSGVGKPTLPSTRPTCALLTRS